MFRLPAMLALFSLTTFAAALPAWADPVLDCSEGEVVPAPGVGQWLRIGQSEFELQASLALAAEGGYDDRLDLELLARWADLEGRSHVGSFLPHLEIDYQLSGPEGSVSAGRLDFRVSIHGAGYGSTIEVPTRFRNDQLRLDLSLDVRGGAADHYVYRDVGCPRFPLELGFKVEPGAHVETPAAPPPGGPNSLRFELLSNWDPGNSCADIWGYSDGTTHLAIIGRFTVTSFVDVTDPTDPIPVAFIDGPNSSWRDIKTYQNYAYMVTEGGGSLAGLQIVDLSNPLSPTLVGTYDATLTTSHNLFIDTDTGIAWVLGTDDGIRILDLSQDPENPVEIGSWTTRYVHDAYIKDGLACFAEINNGLQELLDVQDPANPQSLSVWATPGAKTHNCWANDDQTLLATTDETTGGHVAVYDIADPTGTNPLLSEYIVDPSTIVHNVFFDDEDNHRIAVSHYTLGLEYIDVRRPTMPVQLGFYDTYPPAGGGTAGAWGVYPWDPRGYIYVSDLQTCLYVLNHVPTGGVLSGVVRDEQSGEALSGIQVVLLPQGIALTTGPSGAFATYVDSGPVSLRVSVPGFLTSVTNAVSVPLGGRLDVDIDLELLPGVALTGVVRSAADQSPIEGAKVHVVGTSVNAVSASDGSYLLGSVPIGRRTVAADAFGFSGKDSKVDLGTAQPGTLDFELDPALFFDTAETDSGWTMGLLGSDTATSGQWDRVDPNGTGGGAVQPEVDATPDPGLTAFITGQSLPGASTEDNDVEGGITTLVGPGIDISGIQAGTLSYRRWVSTDSGSLPGGALRVEYQADDGTTWTTLELLNEEANEWVESSFNIGDLVSNTDDVRIRLRFTAEASLNQDQLKVLECGVDDFEIARDCRARLWPAGDDADGDAVVDPCDACPNDAFNDIDGDNVCGNVDNAQFAANPGQADADSDTIGDAADNCVLDSNPDQHDLDGDGLGNACDNDLDGDGLDNAVDPDRDNDGILNAADLCPDVSDAAQLDADSDGEGDPCDADDGIVGGLRIDGDTLSWDPESGSDNYNIYRGDVGPEALLPFASCRIAGVVGTAYPDEDWPNPGEGFLYLVTRVAGGVEGSPGFKSDATERTILAPCVTGP